MKKSLLALAVLGTFAGVASAQSSVTIFGVIDSELRRNFESAGAQVVVTDGITTVSWPGKSLRTSRDRGRLAHSDESSDLSFWWMRSSRTNTLGAMEGSRILNRRILNPMPPNLKA